MHNILKFNSQINKTTTGFFAGLNQPNGITTFDWTTMNYTRHNISLQNDRSFSACALLKGVDGKNVVAIASGLSPGIEVWNPVNGSVQVLNSTFPQAYSGIVQTPKLITVNNGSDLIFYEAFHENVDANKGIWMFHQSNNSGSKIGDMLFPRDDFVAMPVTDLTCD